MTISAGAKRMEFRLQSIRFPASFFLENIHGKRSAQSFVTIFSIPGVQSEERLSLRREKAA
jgi:hypothetical protein